MGVLYISLCVFAVLALITHIAGFYQASHLLELGDRDDPEPDEWPTLSVVIPACNEGETIEAALSSLMGVDYPNLEIIVINDRSTDDTGAILDRLAATDPTVQAVHIETLPEKWLGKLHAVHVGTEASTSDFILYCDSDVHFEEDSLKKAMAWMMNDRLDFLSLMPRMVANSTFLFALVQTFGGLWCVATRPGGINQDKPNCFGGIGAFNMVRREALEQTEGWPWLKMEIADDAGLGYLLHRHGFKARIGIAVNHLSLEWYPSAWAMVLGLEKNAFAAICRFSIFRSLVIVGMFSMYTLAPWILLATPYYWLGIACFSFYILCGWLGPEMGISWLQKVLASQLNIVVAFALLRSTIKTVARGSVDWRGTEYSIPELRAEQRVKF